MRAACNDSDAAAVSQAPELHTLWYRKGEAQEREHEVGLTWWPTRLLRSLQLVRLHTFTALSQPADTMMGFCNQQLWMGARESA